MRIPAIAIRTYKMLTPLRQVASTPNCPRPQATQSNAHAYGMTARTNAITHALRRGGHRTKESVANTQQDGHGGKACAHATDRGNKVIGQIMISRQQTHGDQLQALVRALHHINRDDLTESDNAEDFDSVVARHVGIQRKRCDATEDFAGRNPGGGIE